MQRPEKPFWRVEGVFEPDGQEPDFSCAVGLHNRGRPELHVWAQPDRGVDPGADWKFARLALHGLLGVGAEIERTAAHTGAPGCRSAGLVLLFELMYD